MSKTKKNILLTAKSLFNQLGYSQVTIRMIALELNMSSGNLNYHYRKREDMLEALYFEMVQVFDSRMEAVQGQSYSLSRIRSEMVSSMERMVTYRFFWTDLFNLLKLNTQISTHFESVHQGRQQAYALLFDALEKDGVLHPPAFRHERIFLANRMIDFGNTWLYASSLYAKNEITAAFIASQADQLIAMVYPYLTDKGKAQFQELMPAYFG